MKLAVIKETRLNEKRVALSPQITKQLIAKGYAVMVEQGAGELSAFTDNDYVAAGAVISSSKAALFKEADVFLKINSFSSEEIADLKNGAITLSLMYHSNHPEMLQALASKGVSSFSMDAIPRISRAQSMDVLSSQGNLAGYKAVILGAENMTRIFPLMMTAAGTITPSKVLIFGVGVAGLQAIATAKRLGAVVEATDVRPETKEQAESLGAKFIMVKDEGVKVEGGYAKEVSAEYLAKQKEAVNKSLFQADLVVTTALVMGRKAPVLITEDQVKQMKFGSVIVDMAAEQGGNCELTEPDKVVVRHGVKIVGITNLASTLATNASELYAKNVQNLLQHLSDKEGFKWDLEEEITKGTLIVHQGKVLK
ncbi:MAG: Re/Si-specific NAD(P)(+) transhydrogenase subunit alpha [Saprospiraceae bacterium]|nr:Re/Si-specific NAD(P)(+) transhydrogenase subunit alpha [Candidatus Vicinibacter proximus]MBL7823047.1 Re/Si-specific NAD(P)(+) transhydrogenase subunit alpha [Saprospiraceae bacterium]MCC6842227.1 Re/Si-specific NAD(P)(+) transhydrogenase subunit alpha [Saprospiraceae bacterium]HRG33390.1 Re/Si-specific NAD(P)(+) transhydrogenase subunit alpha [Saprospiraceae bacterium]